MCRANKSILPAYHEVWEYTMPNFGLALRVQAYPPSRLLTMNCWSVLDHFVGLAFKGLIGDEPDKNKFLNYFNKTFHLKNLINESTCFKSQHPSMIDLTLANLRISFMKTVVLETGISDQHKMIFSILKHTFAKGPPKTICYRDLKNCDQKAFNSYMESKMTGCPNPFEKFFQIFQDKCTIICTPEKDTYSL